MTVAGKIGCQMRKLASLLTLAVACVAGCGPMMPQSEARQAAEVWLTENLPTGEWEEIRWLDPTPLDDVLQERHDELLTQWQKAHLEGYRQSLLRSLEELQGLRGVEVAALKHRTTGPLGPVVVTTMLLRFPGGKWAEETEAEPENAGAEWERLRRVARERIDAALKSSR